MSKENTRQLLITQMKRAIELLESEDIMKPHGNAKWYAVNREHSELKSRLREIRRDSVRFIKECKAN